MVLNTGRQETKEGTRDDYPKRLGGLNKRGAWTYNIGRFTSCKTDNGVVYTRDDIKGLHENLRSGNLQGTSIAVSSR
jgi:hypothetical protein